MATLSSVQVFSGASNSYIDLDVLDAQFDSDREHTWIGYFRWTGVTSTALQYVFCKSDAAGGSTGSGQRLFFDGSPATANRYLRYGLGSTGDATKPVRSTNSTIPSLSNWIASASTYAGSGITASTIRHYVAGSGVFSEAAYDAGNSSDSPSGTIKNNRTSRLYIGNRPDGARGGKIELAYLVRINRAMTLSQIQAAFDNGPLSDPDCIFCWANGQDLKGGVVPASTGAGVTTRTTDMPPNLELGEPPAPGVTATVAFTEPSDTFSASATVSQPSGVAAAIAFTEPSDTFTASATVSQPSGVAATITFTEPSDTFTASATVSQPGGVATTLFADFAGANADTTNTTISNASTSTPTVNLVVRTPEDADWQQFLFRLNGVAGKTVTVIVSLAGSKEDNDYFLGTWQGPWWSTDRANNPSGWTNISSWSQVSGTSMTFTVTPGANDEVYIASVPPWTKDVVERWIGELETASPSLIHDDLPSRIALNDGAYVCGRASTAVDENGRSISNLAHYGFRVSQDATINASKKRFVVFSGVHAGEWNGGLQLRGFVAEWLNTPFLLANYDLYVYPLHSVKGNYLGFRRSEAHSTIFGAYDANRQWIAGVGSTYSTVQKWVSIINSDHGTTWADKIVGFYDFHDGKHTSNRVWYHFYPTGNNPSQSDMKGLVDPLFKAQIGGLVDDDLTTTGTTQEYWLKNSGGIQYVWTCECGDEQSTVAQLQAYGAGYARAVKTSAEAGYIPGATLGPVAAIAFTEPSDTFTASATVSQPSGVAAAIAFTEPSDTFSAAAVVSQANRTAVVAFTEPSDTFTASAAVSQPTGPTIRVWRNGWEVANVTVAA